VRQGDGNLIPWTEALRIGDSEMRSLMRQVVDRLYTFRLCPDVPGRTVNRSFLQCR